MRGGEEGNVREFLAEAEEILEAVGEGLVELETSSNQGDPDAEVINAIFRGAHSLKGISAMFGFAQVTEVSHKTETLLDAVRMGRVPCDRRSLDLLFRAADLLKALCGRLAQGHPPEDPGVAAFVEQLVTLAQGEEAAAPSALDALGLSAEAMQVLTEYEVHRLEQTIKHPQRSLVRVRVGFPLESFDTDLEALNEILKGCGEIISTLPSAGPDDGDRLEFEILVGAKVGLEGVSRAVEPFGATAEVLGRVAPGAPMSPAVPAVPAPVLAPAPPLPGAEALAGGGGGEGDLRSLSKTIRVELPKLDALMNLVGELVLAKGRIQRVCDSLRGRMGFAGEAADLAKAQKELARKLGELQQAVMDVRMVPLGQLFSKLHRVVRKLLQDSPKEVDLELHGADTELDKLIVEDLSDPLIHVIRNCLDHGIEEPEVRRAQGKPPRGTVRVAAFQRGNHVVIEVSDDGAGLSRERIRRKAVERGLLGPEDRPESKALFDLVFLPGFSTKDKVTEISGRGVGMDVLRKNIAQLSGLIELWSEEGRGTRITIALPMTLAIIQALLVGVGGQTYAVPLNSVLETLALEPGQIRALEGQPVLRLRDMTMPLVRVDRLFGREGAETKLQYAVIVGVAEKRVAFGVDELLSQQDVVIKALGRRLGQIRGLAGATDLGDQRPVPVLDVAALADEVFEGR